MEKQSIWWEDIQKKLDISFYVCFLAVALWYIQSTVHDKLNFLYQPTASGSHLLPKQQLYFSIFRKEWNIPMKRQKKYQYCDSKLLINSRIAKLEHTLIMSSYVTETQLNLIVSHWGGLVTPCSGIWDSISLDYDLLPGSPRTKACNISQEIYTMSVTCSVLLWLDINHFYKYSSILLPWLGQPYHW